MYIITATDYLKGSAKAHSMKDCSAKTAMKFIFEYILSIFGYPKIIISDQGTHFLNKTIEALTKEFQVYDQKSTP